MTWFFNTDQTETEGIDAYEEMIEQHCIAAWGDCKRHKGADNTLKQPKVGETVFLFCSGRGIVARGEVTGKPIESNTIFKSARDEFQRPLEKFKSLSKERHLTFATILKDTEYNLPCRHIICRIKDQKAIDYINRYINKWGK